MSGPFILIALPLTVAPLVYLLHRQRGLATLLTLATTSLLSLAVLRLPLAEPIHLWRWAFTVNRTMTVLGRPFTFDVDQRPALMFLYLAATLLFAGSAALNTSRTFLPSGLASLGLFSAALFVEPFLFAAIFLQLVAALAVTMVVGPDRPAPRGAVRFLVYQTMGMPFILVTGWLLEGSAVSPGDLSLVTRATILLSAGFAILLAVIPFHTWIPQLADDAPPVASAFVFIVLQGFTVFLMLRFFNEFEWLRHSALAYSSLRIAGLAMIAYGGATGFAQQRFGRLMGYAIMMDIGATLLALGQGTAVGFSTALVTVAARTFGLGLWAVGMSVLRDKVGGGEFDRLKGAAWRWPLASAGMLVGGLSVAGFPLTIGFVGRWALFGELTATELWPALMLLAASGALAVAYARGLSKLLSPSVGAVLQSREGVGAKAALSIGLVLVLGLGLFPQWVVPAVARAVLSLRHLGG